jgi:hypothetical protein
MSDAPYDSGDDLEPGSGVSDVAPGVGEIVIVVEGQLVFERRSSRHLVMICEPFVGSRYFRRVAREFKAALREHAGDLVVDTLELRPLACSTNRYELDEGLTWQIMRATSPDAIVDLARRSILGQKDLLDRVLALSEAHDRTPAETIAKWVTRRQELTALKEQLRARRPTARQGGRPTKGDDHYRRVAIFCLSLYEKGEHKGIHEKLAKRFDCAPRTAADWIREARSREFLATGKPGRVHFEPGRLLYDTNPPTQGET